MEHFGGGGPGKGSSVATLSNLYSSIHSCIIGSHRSTIHLIYSFIRHLLQVFYRSVLSAEAIKIKRPISRGRDGNQRVGRAMEGFNILKDGKHFKCLLAKE